MACVRPMNNAHYEPVFPIHPYRSFRESRPINQPPITNPFEIRTNLFLRYRRFAFGSCIRYLCETLAVQWLCRDSVEKRFVDLKIWSVKWGRMIYRILRWKGIKIVIQSIFLALRIEPILKLKEYMMHIQIKDSV
jgi:hypothetical protein